MKRYALLILYGAINHQITHIVVASGVFAGCRSWIACRSSKLGELVSCHLCFGTWVGFVLSLIFRPRYVPQPRVLGPLAPVAQVMADGFAIALAGRFFTEILGYLAREVSVAEEERRAIQAQRRQIERSSIVADLG